MSFLPRAAPCWWDLAQKPVRDRFSNMQTAADTVKYPTNTFDRHYINHDRSQSTKISIYLSIVMTLNTCRVSSKNISPNHLNYDNGDYCNWTFPLCNFITANDFILMKNDTNHRKLYQNKLILTSQKYHLRKPLCYLITQCR